MSRFQSQRREFLRDLGISAVLPFVSGLSSLALGSQQSIAASG